MEFDREKFEAVCAYVQKRCKSRENVDKTLLCNLLYFCDFNYYEKYESSMTNESYIKCEDGSYPKHLNEVNSTYSLSDLSTEEQGVIDEVIDSLGNLPLSAIVEYTCGDMPWRVADANGEIEYEYVFYRDDEYSVRDYGDDWH